MHIQFSYPTWFFLLCLGLGFVFSFLLYQKQIEKFSNKILFYSLAALRFLAVSLLAFLLLSPMLRYKKTEVEKPLIVLLHDNSASQKSAFKKIDSVAFRKNILSFKEKLSADFNVKMYDFGNTISDTMLFDYNEKSTDISQAIELAISNHENENLSSIVLTSDGIFNQGQNPGLQQFPFQGSIYAIGVGDTSINTDAQVARLFANKLVYLGDKFSIRADIAAFGAQEQQVSISVYHHNGKRNVSQQQVSISGNRFSKSIELIQDASSPGIHHYSVKVSALNGEQNLVNNEQDVYVEVMDSKDNILLLANAPHPDIQAIEDALSKNKNYKITVATISQSANFNIAVYNLLILHNLPSANNNISSLISKAKQQGISTWFIAGSQTAIGLLNSSQTALNLKPKSNTGIDVFGQVNPNFSFFTLPTAGNIVRFPPLYAPFVDISLGANTQVLFNQRIGSVNTSYPLWVFQGGNAKTAVLLGEGLWQWRLYDFKTNKSFELTDNFISKAAQYLCVKLDKRKFRVLLPKTVFSENELIPFDAELYNDNLELINTPDVNLTIINADNKKTITAMNKTNNSYSLNEGPFSAGNYTYSASCVLNGKEYAASGNFKIIAQNIEEMNTTADFGMLNQLAKNHNGEFLYSNQWDELIEKIKKNPNIKTKLITDLKTTSFIDYKWFFAIAFLLLAIEWFLRKRNGNY